MLFLANVVASGTPETIGGALLTGLLGYIVVFKIGRASCRERV